MDAKRRVCPSDNGIKKLSVCKVFCNDAYIYYIYYIYYIFRVIAVELIIALPGHVSSEDGFSAATAPLWTPPPLGVASVVP
jgi:hypothetical protein